MARIESKTDLIRCRDLIGGHLYPTNQVGESWKRLLCNVIVLHVITNQLKISTEVDWTYISDITGRCVAPSRTGMTMGLRLLRLSNRQALAIIVAPAYKKWSKYRSLLKAQRPKPVEINVTTSRSRRFLRLIWRSEKSACFSIKILWILAMFLKPTAHMQQWFFLMVTSNSFMWKFSQPSPSLMLARAALSQVYLVTRSIFVITEHIQIQPDAL